jgi:acyl carrier protein
MQEEVLVVLEEKFGVKREDVTMETRLHEDLDLDSIDLFDMMGVLEERICVSVDVNDFLRAKTVGDFISILEELVKHRPVA